MNNAQSSVESYAVGIDLGTTNAVLAYAPMAKGLALAESKILPVGQWVSDGVWQEKPMLPTYRYHPLPDEHHLLVDLPFRFKPLEQDFPVLFGEYAVKLGAVNPGQGVASAKSWLSQASRVHQDAKDRFLPFGTNQHAKKSVELVSPLIASASYLHYLHAWWNHCFPEFALSEQTVVITLPASFDEYARDLTLAAAEIAGLAQAQFLEEPTAAAYAWVDDNRRNQTSKLVNPGMMCVLDIGGGTTDLSLIDFSGPSPQRVAVGEHLMLGGDNLDSALVHTAVQQMEQDRSQKLSLSPVQWSQLMIAARESKERLLGNNPPDTVSIALVGRGSALIGQQQLANLNSRLTVQSLLDGFLPMLAFDQLLEAPARAAGLVQIGLKFEQDPAITRHLLAFLRESGHNVDSVLLNGGFFNSEQLVQQIHEQFRLWQGADVTVLRPVQPQLAVALGAVLYAQAKQAHLLSLISNDDPNQAPSIIGGGAARSLFLKLDDSSDEKAQSQAVCVAVVGMEESQPVVLEKEFALAVNQPVQFVLLSTAKKVNVKLGDVVVIDPAWSQLPPLQVTITSDSASLNSSSTVQVKLVSEMTQVGSLALQFKACQADLRLSDTLLEFAGRSSLSGARLDKTTLPASWPRVQKSIVSVYGSKNQIKAHGQATLSEKEMIAQLRKSLDELGPKNSWNLTLCRSLADVLLQYRKNRRRSALHESFWLSTLGFALRPGHGVVGDINRLDYVEEVLEQPPAHHEHSVWFAWWTLVRRCAQGLGYNFQQRLFQTHESKIKSLMIFVEQKGKQAKKAPKKGAKQVLSNKEQDLKNRAPEAMLRAIASLERLRGETWFEPLLFQLHGREALGVNQQIIDWCFAQVVYRYAVSPLPVAQVTTELDKWLLERWQTCPELGLAASLAVQVHSDFAVALPESYRSAVEQKLVQDGLPNAWQLSIRAPATAQMQAILSGEGLPLGLKSV